MIHAQYSIDPSVRFQWPTQEPFLFCVHHLDNYPKMHANYGPDPALLKGRNMGQDFEGKDGFRMYHGEVVPGFPVHPHRGFETVTIVRRGYVDHADSMQAAGRYGEGDVQWMTAGAGVQHSEMFPLLKKSEPNPVELFQIWLNLPKKSKLAKPHFTMFWSEKLPRWKSADGKVVVDVISGEVGGVRALAPPPDSWAAEKENDVHILLLKIQPGGEWKFPAGRDGAKRTLYFFGGDGLSIQADGRDSLALPPRTATELDANVSITLKSEAASNDLIEVLVLQAMPIGEPVVQYGPFVMNTREEIVATIHDYQNTQFGGWTWPSADPVHGDVIERFARFPEGRIEKP